MEGVVAVNGVVSSLDDGARGRLVIGFALRCLNFFLMLFVALRGVGILLSDADRGGATFDLTAPLGRGRFLLGRGIGLILLLAAIWAVFLALLAGAMRWRLGAVHGNLLAGGVILLLGQILLGEAVLSLRLLLGRGWGELTGLLLWAASGLLSLDIVESYLFDTGGSAGGASWWYPMFEPYLAGAPAGGAATFLRLLVRFFPPAANVQSVGIDVATGATVFPRLDYQAIPVAAVWCLLLGGIASFLFRRKDLA